MSDIHGDVRYAGQQNVAFDSNHSVYKAQQYLVCSSAGLKLFYTCIRERCLDTAEHRSQACQTLQLSVVLQYIT